MTTQPPESLYRQQAIDAQALPASGTILLAQPVPARVAAWSAGALLVGLALLLTLGQYTRKVHAAGSLVPAKGNVHISASTTGRVTRLVENGQRVVRNQPLFTIDAERPDTDREVSTQLGARLRERAQSGSLQAEELRQSGHALDERLTEIEQTIASRRRALAAQEQVVAAARDKQRRYRALARQGYVSAASVTDLSAALAEQQGRREDAQSALLSALRDLSSAREQLRAVRVKLDQIDSAARQDIAGLRQEAAEHAGRTRTRVLAPIDGIVTALGPDDGQTVGSGAELATVLPAGSPLEARLLVPARAIQFVTAGQTVSMRLDGVPSDKFGRVEGVVTHVDLSPSAASDAAVMYRVTVRLARQSATMYGQARQFAAGMPLEADILQDHRRLYEWMLDPLISAADRRAP